MFHPTNSPWGDNLISIYTMFDSPLYHLATSARAKLCLEASSSHQDLRRILGHADMLDNLVGKLAILADELEGEAQYLEGRNVYDPEEDEFYDEDAAIHRSESCLKERRDHDGIAQYVETTDSSQFSNLPNSDSSASSEPERHKSEMSTGSVQIKITNVAHEILEIPVLHKINTRCCVSRQVISGLP